MKQEKRIAVIIMVAALVVISIIVARWLTKHKSTDSGDTSDEPTSGGNTQTASFPLRRGSRGTQVTQLQRWLNTNTSGLIYDTSDGLIYVSQHNSVGVDGQFGAETERELKAATGMTEVSKDYFTKTYMNSL